LGDTPITQNGTVTTSCTFISSCQCLCDLSITVTISLNDWFRDPLDLGIEFGGTPYEIYDQWSDEREEKNVEVLMGSTFCDKI
jgi:hypothetical protein